MQGFAHVPLLSPTLPDAQRKPLEQLPLQQSLEVLQVPPSDVHAAAQVPPSHFPLQHCAFFLHFFPSGLHRLSAPASPMPSDASVPPTRAAPINLSALPREMLPLARPLVSSSK